MKLLTKEILKKLPPLYSTKDKDTNEIMVYLKLFTPDANGTWYIAEYDPETEIMYGFCNPMGDKTYAELDIVSFNELKSIRGSLGLPIERDRSWKPKTLKDVIATIKNGGQL